MFAKKRGLDRAAGPPVHDDLVDRKFAATAPNVTWLTDITEHNAAEGKLSLCVIKDVYSPDRRLLHPLEDERVPRGGGAA